MRLLITLLVVSVLALGCRRDRGDDAGAPRADAGSPPRDAGSPPRDAGARIDAGVDAASDAGAVDEAAVAAALIALEYGATVASLVSGPLVPDAEMLDETSDTATDATIRERVESGVATNSIVTDAGCVTFDWTARTATITFSDCTAEATGHAIDGAVSFAVTLRPTTFAVSLDALTIGAQTLAGSITMVVGGAASARTFTLAAQLTWSDGTTANELTLTDVAVTVDGTAMTTTLDGALVLTTDGTVVTGSIDAVTWQLPECHPSSGALDLNFNGGPRVLATFLPTTPTEGTVSVAFSPLPAVEMDLLEPCPSP